MVKTGESLYEGRTFKEVSGEWLSSIRDRVAHTTYSRYQTALEKDIYPEYADTPMKDVTEAEVDRFFAHMRKLAEKRGRTSGKSSLIIIRTVMNSVIQYAGETEGQENIPFEVNPYEVLSQAEIEKICIRAKYHRSPEMLSVLLALYCGMRIGELCALSCSDIDLDRMEIYIHRTMHRGRNPDKDSDKKTITIIEEMPVKKQIRRVRIPEALKGYIEEYILPGRTLFRAPDGLLPVDRRTLGNRLARTMEAFRLRGINYERLRMTYMNGMADVEILDNVFRGNTPDRPYSRTMDTAWQTAEMGKDLAPLRMFMGLSPGEMGSVLGVSEETYRGMENGSRGMSWDEYLSLLFIFHYNGRTADIIAALGLFPQSVKESIKIEDIS